MESNGIGKHVSESLGRKTESTYLCNVRSPPAPKGGGTGRGSGLLTKDARRIAEDIGVDKCVLT